MLKWCSTSFCRDLWFIWYVVSAFLWALAGLTGHLCLRGANVCHSQVHGLSGQRSATFPHSVSVTFYLLRLKLKSLHWYLYTFFLHFNTLLLPFCVHDASNYDTAFYFAIPFNLRYCILICYYFVAFYLVLFSEFSARSTTTSLYGLQTSNSKNRFHMSFLY